MTLGHFAVDLSNLFKIDSGSSLNSSCTEKHENTHVRLRRRKVTSIFFLALSVTVLFQAKANGLLAAKAGATSGRC